MNKNIIFSVLVILAFLLSVSSAFAIVPSLITPAASATISGEASLNSSCSDCTAHNLFNVTYTLQGVTGSNTSSVTLKIIADVNFSAGTSNRTGEHFSTLQYDDAVYNVVVAIKNQTSGLSTSTTNSGIYISNGVPTAPASCTATNFQNLTFSIECAVDDKSTTNVTISWINGQPTAAASDIPTYVEGSARAYSVITTSSVGTFAYYMTASDGLNSTAGAPFYISARRPAGASGVDSGVEGAGGSPSLAFMQSKLPASFSEAVNVESVKGAAVGGAIGAVIGFLIPIPGASIVGGIAGALFGGWLW